MKLYIHSEFPNHLMIETMNRSFFLNDNKKMCFIWACNGHYIPADRWTDWSEMTLL